MDTGGFYRRGASISSSFTGPNGDMSHTYTSTPNSGFAGFQPPATPIEYSSMTQKMDQLLHLFLEEKKEITELKGIVSALTEKVTEAMERQEEAAEKKAGEKCSYKVPTDISVSSSKHWFYGFLRLLLNSVQ